MTSEHYLLGDFGAQIIERKPEMRQHVGGQKRLLARSAIEYRNLGGASAKPCAEPGGIVTRQFLRDESRGNSGKHVAHSAGRHSGIAGRVVAERMMTFRDDCAAAFEEKRHRIFRAKAFCDLRARLLLRREDSFYFARVRREQPRAFATFQHRRFAGKNIERIRIDHHRLPRRLNESDNFVGVFARDQDQSPIRRLIR